LYHPSFLLCKARHRKDGKVRCLLSFVYLTLLNRDITPQEAFPVWAVGLVSVPIALPDFRLDTEYKARTPSTNNSAIDRTVPDEELPAYVFHFGFVEAL
jgi:hypothetical protein